MFGQIDQEYLTKPRKVDDSVEVKFTDGRSFFVLSKTGWRVNANASGTKYWQDKDLN